MSAVAPNYNQQKSADPRFGVLDHVGGETVGGGLPPPTPSAWAPSAQPLGPIRLFALYTYIGAYLWLKSKNPAAPGIELFLAPCAILSAGA